MANLPQRMGIRPTPKCESFMRRSHARKRKLDVERRIPRCGAGSDPGSRVFPMMRWFRRQGYFARAVLAIAVAWLLAAPAPAAPTGDMVASARAADAVTLDLCAVGGTQRHQTHDCPASCPACPAGGGCAEAGAGLLWSAVSYPPPARTGRIAVRSADRAIIRSPRRVNLGSPRAPPARLS